MNELKVLRQPLPQPERVGRRDPQALGRAREYRSLWKREHVSAAVRYVVDDQGEAMAVFEAFES